MKFSLIVVTTDRLLLTERLFLSLAAQTCKNFEILFVHGQACTADAQQLAKKYVGKLTIQALPSQDYCLSRSRNMALPLATGDAIAFPDDDCVYEPNTLDMCAAAFVQEPNAGVILADTVDLGEKTPSASTAPVELNRYSLFRRSISFAQFYRKECICAVGKFDEELGVGSATPWQSGEDTEYALRASKAGFRIFYAPSVVVRHPAVNLLDATLQEKVRGYACGRMRLLHKHGFPGWFVLLNILYPLLAIPVESLKGIARVVRYRWTMFTARLMWRKVAK